MLKELKEKDELFITGQTGSPSLRPAMDRLQEMRFNANDDKKGTNGALAGRQNFNGLARTCKGK